MNTLYAAGPSIFFLQGIKTILYDQLGPDHLQLYTDLRKLRLILSQQPLPQLLLLDISLLGDKGLGFSREVSKANPLLKIMVFHTDDSLRTIRDLLRQGIKGYARPQLPPEELISAVQDIASGKTFIDYELRKKLSNDSLGLHNGHEHKKNVCLTPRELEVLQLIVEEFTTKEIAKQLFISTCTVETHRIHIIQKLGVKNTAGVVREALRRHLYLV